MKTKALVMTMIVVILSLFIGVVGAQEDEAQPNRIRIVRALGGDVVDIVTESTGLTTADILQAMRNGSTLSEIITENGGDAEAVIAEVEAELTTRIETALENEQITQAVADRLLENLSDNINTFFTTTHEISNSNGLRERVQDGVLGIVAETVTDATGLELTDITQALRDGSTLAEVITDNGGDVEAVTATILDNVTTAVNERVENSDLTQEQADIILENLDSRITDWMNGELSFRTRRRGRGNN